MPAQLPESLMAFQARVLGPDQLELVCAHGDGSAMAGLDAVRSAGLVIRDITTKEAGLEDLFLHMTAKPV